MTVGLISIRAGYAAAPVIDIIPDAYTITSVTGATLGAQYTANTSAITGINSPTNWTVSGASSTAMVNGASSAASSGTLTVGQFLAVTGTASSSNSTETDVFINIGGVLATFAITTVAAQGTGTEASAFMGPFLSSTATRALSSSWSIWDNYWTTYEQGHYNNYVNPAYHSSGGLVGELTGQFGSSTYGRAAQYMCQADRYPASASDYVTKAQLIQGDYVSVVSTSSYDYSQGEQWQEFKAAAILAKKFGDAPNKKLLGEWGAASHVNLIGTGYFGYFKGTLGNAVPRFDDTDARWIAHGLEALCGAYYNSVADQNYHQNGLLGNDWGTYAGTLVDQITTNQEADGAWRFYKVTQSYNEGIPFQMAQICEALRIYDRSVSTAKRAAIVACIAKFANYLEFVMLDPVSNTYWYSELDGGPNALARADTSNNYPTWDIHGWWLNFHGFLYWATGDQQWKDRLTRIINTVALGNATIVFENPDHSPHPPYWKQFGEMFIAGMSASYYWGTTPITTAVVPYCSALPTISGTTTTGQTLTVSTGTWSNSPTGATYQWYRYYGPNLATTHFPAEPIGSATGSTYVLTSSDTGQKIFCKVYRSNSSGAGVPVRTATTATIA